MAGFSFIFVCSEGLHCGAVLIRDCYVSWLRGPNQSQFWQNYWNSLSPDGWGR